MTRQVTTITHNPWHLEARKSVGVMTPLTAMILSPLFQKYQVHISLTKDLRDTSYMTWHSSDQCFSIPHRACRMIPAILRIDPRLWNSWQLAGTDGLAAIYLDSRLFPALSGKNCSFQSHIWWPDYKLGSILQLSLWNISFLESQEGRKEGR